MKEHVEVFWFSEQPYGHVTDKDLAQYPSGQRYTRSRFNHMPEPQILSPAPPR